MWAQHKGGPRLSPEQFRAKQKEFIIQKAELTKDEANKFFPLFFELQDKKKEINDNVWKLMKKGREKDLKEEEYEKIIEDVIDSRLKSDQLEKEYYKRYKKVLSAKKIYKVQHAEMRFHRELLKDMNQESQEKSKKK